MCYSYPQILYVDRDANTCEMVRLLLQQADQDLGITTVVSGNEAWDMISKRSFDLYIFDNPWSESSGLELCRQVRQQDGKTPILIFSVMGHEIDRDNALEAGANSYLVKPNDVGRLTDEVKRLLDGSKNGYKDTLSAAL
jgi:DNA-binding response OmpR family regulator